MISTDLVLIKKELTYKNIFDDKYSYVVYCKDNNPFKISDFGKHILDLIDGKRSVQDVFNILLKDKNDIELDTLSNFIVTLSANNIFENFECETSEEKPFLKKISFIKLLSFSNDTFFKYIAEKYNGNLVLLIAFLYSTSITWALIHYFYSGFSFSIHFNSETINNITLAHVPIFVILFFTLTFTKIALHESAHAVSCRFFGQKVRGIGLGLYLFSPVFYVDTTNIWHVENKYKRIMVSFAGPFSDMAFVSSLYLFQSFFITDYIYANYFSVIISVYLIKAFLNLNPFLKLDGYYMIMDFLETPNLRTHSLNYLKGLFLKSENTNQLSTKKKFLFLFFGLFSFIITLVFIVRLLVLVLDFILV